MVIFRGISEGLTDLPAAQAATRRMPQRLMCFLSALFVAGAVLGDDSPTPKGTRMRHQALAGFSFDEQAKPEATQELAREEPTEFRDPNVVPMEAVQITTSALDRDLAADVKKTRSPHAESHRKLGTGVVEKDFGKVRMAAVTIFYVPILVGFSW